MISSSILIPVYKEESTIEKTLINIIDAFKKNKLNFEIITIVDKALNDTSHEIIERLSTNFSEITLVTRNEKLGISSAIIDGIRYVKNDITIIVMGDGSEDPNDLIKIVKKMNEGYDMVFGNRFFKQVKMEGYPKKKFIANRLCNWAIRILFGIKSSDVTNAVKAYKTSILKNIKITSTGFEIFVEMPIKVYSSGYKNFTEVRLSHKAGDISHSKFNLTNEGPRYFKAIIKCLITKNRSLDKDLKNE